jgi:hypothetical protein
VIVVGGGTTCFMSVETRDDAVTKDFVDGLKKHGFNVHIESLEDVDPEYQHVDLNIFRITKDYVHN